MPTPIVFLPFWDVLFGLSSKRKTNGFTAWPVPVKPCPFCIAEHHSNDSVPFRAGTYGKCYGGDSIWKTIVHPFPNPNFTSLSKSQILFYGYWQRQRLGPTATLPELWKRDSSHIFFQIVSAKCSWRNCNLSQQCVRDVFWGEWLLESHLDS